MKFPEKLLRVYEGSAGWAGEFDTDVPPGGTFTWRDREWQVVAYFAFPCCGARVALVRKAGSDLRQWSGLRCPKECTAESYTVEREWNASWARP